MTTKLERDSSQSHPFFPFYGAKLQNIIANMSLANYICTLNNVDIPKPGQVGSVQQDRKTFYIFWKAITTMR